MTNAMRFEKKIFMGIELDVLVGHPEHGLLFVATQVARAAGLQKPSQSIAQHGHLRGSGARLQVSEVESLYKLSRDGHMIKSNSWLFDEARIYDLLMRGNAPQSEPFRKWVTEEVLPTIRKTGSYNAADSTNPIAQGVMDELKAVRGEVVELRAIIAKLVEAQQQKPSLWTQGQPSVSSYQVPMRA